MSSKKRSRRPPPRKSTATRQRATGASGASAASGQRGAPFYTPGGSPFRHSVEKASAPLLLMLTQAPRWIVTFVPLILVLLGFFLPLALGLVALAIFFLFTGWLAYLSWPRADLKARLIRVAMLALVIALTVLRIARS